MDTFRELSFYMYKIIICLRSHMCTYILVILTQTLFNSRLAAAISYSFLDLATYLLDNGASVTLTDNGTVMSPGRSIPCYTVL